MVLSAPFANNYLGKAYIIFGRNVTAGPSKGFPASMNVSQIEFDGSNGVMLLNTQAETKYFGLQLRCVPDLNGEQGSSDRFDNGYTSVHMRLSCQFCQMNNAYHSHADGTDISLELSRAVAFRIRPDSICTLISSPIVCLSFPLIPLYAFP